MATAARACRSASSVLGILVGPSGRRRRALVELGLENGQDLLRLPLGDREEARKGFRVGIHEQIGQQVGIVRGVVGEDVGGQDVLGLGAGLVAEDRRERVL